jgi:hypothetical protein
MTNRPVFELASLPERHPLTGATFLSHCSGAAVVRLGLDPTPLLHGSLKRVITVARKSPRTNMVEREEQWEIGWSGVAGVSEADCVGLKRTFSERRIT